MGCNRPIRYLDHDNLFDRETGERVRCKRCWTKGNWVGEMMKFKMYSDDEGYQLDFFDCCHCGRETYMVRGITFAPVSEEVSGNAS